MYVHFDECFGVSGLKWSGSLTCLHHLGNDLHKSTILQCRSDSFFVTELLIDLISCAMVPFFDAHVDPKPGGKRLLQTYPHSEADDGCKTTVGNGWGDQHSDRLKRGIRHIWKGWFDEDIGEGNDGQLS